MPGEGMQHREEHRISVGRMRNTTVVHWTTVCVCIGLHVLCPWVPHESTLCGKIAVHKSSFYTLVSLILFKNFPYKPDTFSCSPMSCCLIHGLLSRKGVYVQVQTQRASTFATKSCAGYRVPAWTKFGARLIATNNRGHHLDV